jgi:lysophospholipase L1-like esterase
MKRILCYGDSNTWGFNPENSQRYSREDRWTGVLAQALGPGCEVIEEGLNARTTVWDDPVEGLHKNGKTCLLACLESHAPLDLVIIMLGTNDLKQRFSLPASDIAEGAGVLVDLAMKSNTGINGHPPRVLLVAPIAVGANIAQGALGESRLGQMFGADSHPRSLQFPQWYKTVANTLGCFYLNAAEFAAPSPRDSIHLEAGDHRTLGQAIAKQVWQILKPRRS